MSKPAYLIVRQQVKDFGVFMEKYGAFFRPVMEKYGGEFVAANTEGELLEGDMPGNWDAILRFPSIEQARAFHNSEEYAPLKRIRMEELVDGGQTVLLPGKLPFE